MDLPARSSSSQEGQCELDSHADTTAAGSNMILLQDQVVSHVDVHPFSPELEPIKGIPIGTCVTAYTASNGKVWLIYFHEALYFGDKLSHSLICPNQIRDCHPNRVDETPRQYDPKSRHSIHIDNVDPEDPTVGNALDIKLMLDGIVSYFPSRRPTRHEMETCDHVVATRDVPWNPSSQKFEQAESAIDHSDPMEETTVSVLRAKRTLEPVESNFNPGLYDEPLRREELILPTHDSYEQYKLRSLQQLCTRRNLTECSTAFDSRYVDADDSFGGLDRFECQDKDYPVCLSSVYKHVQWKDEVEGIDVAIDPETEMISRRKKWGPRIDTEDTPRLTQTSERISEPPASTDTPTTDSELQKQACCCWKMVHRYLASKGTKHHEARFSSSSLQQWKRL